MQSKFQELKNDLNAFKASYAKLFLKQGSFSLYYSKEVDNFVKKTFKIILEDFFEDFLPDDESVPLCILAHHQYADFKLAAYENLPLLFVYKDVPAYHLKPIMKAFIAALNDLGFVMQAEICELNGLVSKAKLGLDLLNLRYLCGSKALFKAVKETSTLYLQNHKLELANKILSQLNHTQTPFIAQEFDIKKDFGGLDNYLLLRSLLLLFKNSPQSYALEFIDENELSELRLAMDFLLSLKSALNIEHSKDEDEFQLAKLDFLSKLMQKKDKKSVDAKKALLQKAMSSMQTSGIYALYLQKCIQNLLDKNENLSKIGHFKQDQKGVIYLDESMQFQNASEFLAALNSLEDKPLEFDISVLMSLRRLRVQKDEFEELLKHFKQSLCRKHSFSLLKLFFDSSFLSIMLKPLASFRFLLSEEGAYSLDENALLCLKELELSFDEFECFKALNADETMILKLSVVMSAIEAENEVSLANIYRSYCAKLSLNADLVEFGLRVFKNFNAMKDIIEKEDIYNETIIFTLISRLENEKTLRLIHALTLINARVLHITHDFYFRSLEKLLLNALAGFEDVNYLDEIARRVKKEQTLKRSKVFLDQSSILQDKITHIVSNLFIIKNSFEDIVKIAKIAQQKDFSFSFNNEKNLILEMIALKQFDIASILNALSSLNLIFMSFFQLFDEKIYLKFEYSNTISDIQKQKLTQLLEQNLVHKNKIELKKPSIKKDELKFDLEYSKSYVKLNLNAKDQQGLMAFVMHEFKRFDLNLSAAKIQTIKGRTRNSFYFEKNENLLQKKDELIKSLTSE
ncbi:nucleotidyltransferase [Campylobacter sp. MIT 12-5580]|nr:nucleotidyltransferase [Campylobacter sp. MIT 12-5580]